MTAVGTTTTPSTGAHAPVLARLRRTLGNSRLVPYYYLAPMLVLLGLFTYWPFVHTVYLSLTEWNLRPDTPLRFVGAANFAGITDNRLFQDALRNTLIYIAGSIPLKVLLPIPIAVFLWLLNPIGGHAQQFFGLFGLSFPNVLGRPDSALWTILLISTWKIIGFNTLLYIAGLASINRDYVEAMRIDGAGDWAVLRHLIWPLLTPTTFFVLIATVIFSIQQVFTPIDIMTEGGPANGTTNLFYMVYQYAFVVFNVGYGAAGTVMLFVLLLAITLIKVRLLDRHVHYDQ